MNNYHSVKIKPVKIFKILMAIVIVLLICHIVGYLHKVKVGEGVITYSFEPLFNLDYENTVPSFFSSLILILAALILMSIASDPQTSSYRRHWWILSIIFIYLAFDEFCGFHEILTMPVRNRIDLSGWIYHVPWLIPAAVIMIIFALIFLKFIFYLPLKFRTLFISSAAIYLLGAVGVEIMGAVYTETVYYQIVMPIEETLEMSGIIMFIYSLLSFKEMYGRPMLVNIRK